MAERWGSEAHDKRAAYASEHLDWFDFVPMYEVLGCGEAEVLPKRSRVPVDGFNRYHPDFLYRYRQLPSVTVEQFIALAVRYSVAAQGWMPAQT